ncbi:helix-turn-helix domain-containing protein [Eubacterium sp.]|uniref:helix-turn-helix domain-containing protein n=1 Tax=Eubacterium sp. TaxID=142586 RepID=UPI003EFD11AF
MDIYDKIDALIKENNLSRRKLAIDIDLAPSTFQSIMSRKSGISTELLKRIAHRFGISVQKLYETENVIIPGRLKIIYIDDPDNNDVVVKIDAADKEAFEYGISIINGQQSIDEESLLNIKINALFNCLNIENKRVAVECVEKIADDQYKANQE